MAGLAVVSESRNRIHGYLQPRWREGPVQCDGRNLIVAAFGSGLTGTLGAARLLFGMGRDDVLPESSLASLNPVPALRGTISS